MKPKKRERLIEVLKKGISLEDRMSPGSQLTAFEDAVLTGRMKEILAEDWVGDEGRLFRWLAPAFGRIAYEVENGGYGEDLEGLDLEVLKEHLVSEVEADITMLREVEEAYGIAFRFIGWLIEDMES